METMFHLRLGLPVTESKPAEADEIDGWLLVSAPPLRPCTVVGMTSVVGHPDGTLCGMVP
jgi:hypothetical protein